jgi:hypothetical protein
LTPTIARDPVDAYVDGMGLRTFAGRNRLVGDLAAE